MDHHWFSLLGGKADMPGRIPKNPLLWTSKDFIRIIVYFNMDKFDFFYGGSSVISLILLKWFFLDLFKKC